LANESLAPVDQQLVDELAGVAKAVAGMATAPSGEQEARLRKADASGELVRAANGDVIYVPVCKYSGKFFTTPENKPSVKFLRKSSFNPALEACLDQRDKMIANQFDMGFFAETLIAILRENYPALTAEEMGVWTGDIEDGNPTISNIMATFNGIKKGVL
jgi:hypothetical protein